MEGSVLLIATLFAGTFFGAAIYINLVEHPARVECGVDVAVREFGPSYRRAAVMQGSLAVAGCLLGLIAAWLSGDRQIAAAALLLGAVVPVTLILIFPTNKKLLDPTLDVRNGDALLARWNRLHSLRTVLSGIAFVWMLLRLMQGGLV